MSTGQEEARGSAPAELPAPCGPVVTRTRLHARSSRRGRRREPRADDIVGGM